MLRLFRNMGIWPRLALTVSIGFLTFFIIFTIHSIDMVNNSTQRIFHERQVLTQIAANEIDALLSGAFYELETATNFARFDPQADNLEEEYDLLIHTYGRRGIFLLGVYFYDAMGKVILAEPSNSGIIGSDQSIKPNIRQVIETNRRSISLPFKEARTGAPAVALTVPIFDEQGQLMAMLSGFYDLSGNNIRRLIEQALNLGQDGHAEIVDSRGMVIVSTDSNDFLEPGEHVDFYQRMMLEKRAGVENVPYEADEEGEKAEMHIMAFVPLSTVEWGVAVGGNSADTLAPVTTLRNNFFLLGGIMLVAILIATLIGARYLVSPIKKLTKSAQEITSGNLNTAIQVSNIGEIGVLGGSLEEMRVSLRESFETINTLNVELEERVQKRTRELEEKMTEVSKLQVRQEVDRLKSEFISSISHELRTPLGFIVGYVTTLLRSDIPHSEEARLEFLQIIEEESEKLQKLIENLLDSSRMQTSGFTIEKKSINMVQLVQKVVEKMQPIKDTHSLLPSLDSSLPLVPGDAWRIEQVLNNLIDNAIKYSAPNSLITIKGDIKGDDLQISVIDEGRGISRVELSNIFEAFYRIQDSYSQKVRGAGLGLAVCRAIIEAHGGRIWVESDPGKGSVFSFTLPLREDA